MSEHTQLQTAAETAIVAPARAMTALPRQQASWVAAQVGVAALLGAVGLWASQPNLALSLAIGAGVAVVNPRKLWAAPVVLAVVVASGLAFEALRLPAVLGAGLSAGIVAAWLVPQVADWVDTLNGALATAAATSIGLWAAIQLVPEALGGSLSAGLTAAIVGLLASQGLVPLALRFDAIKLPPMRVVRKTLAENYRPPVFKAFQLFRETARVAPDREATRGLCEVSTWVFRLQTTLQTLDKELVTIDVDDVQGRIAACDSDDAADEFTRERRRATADHLRRLLEHRDAIAVERTRTEALVGYALAFLEEARAGLAVARQLPGEQSPDRLPEVLHRLRHHAAEGDARRRTAREMENMQV